MLSSADVRLLVLTYNEPQPIRSALLSTDRQVEDPCSTSRQRQLVVAILTTVGLLRSTLLLLLLLLLSIWLFRGYRLQEICSILLLSSYYSSISMRSSVDRIFMNISYEAQGKCT